MIPNSMEWLGVLGLLVGTTAHAAPTDLHSHADLMSAARDMATAHPEHVQWMDVATSRAGREVFCLKLSGKSETPVGTPALLLVAGLDGPRAYTSSMAMSHASELLAGYGDDDAITALLDTTTIYIIPRFDVDACEARFASPLAEVHASGRGVDNDRDGRDGEDPPADVNGDGFITVMRQLDGAGTWIEDPTDPRVMIEAKSAKGERGKWKLYTEGFDTDGDEEVAEDSPLDAVANRNFPRNWTEHAPSAGRYPTDEPGALGMTRFFLDHPDIAMVVTYGDEGNLSEKPESQSDSGAPGGSITTGVYKQDLPIHEELGERYRDLTSNKFKAMGEQAGSLQSFVYHHRGLICLDIDPWTVPLDAKPEATEESSEETTEEDGESTSEESKEAEAEASADKKKEPKPSDDAKRLIWLDQNREGAFLPWTSFEHPQLGEVEIGGFAPYAKIEPTATRLAELSATHFEFFKGLGALLPRIEWRDVEAKSLGGGLVELTATLENPSLLPQQSRAAERSRAVRPARVTLELPAGATLMGGRSQQLVNNLAGSGGRREFRWLLSGVDANSELRIQADSDNAGVATHTVEVN